MAASSFIDAVPKSASELSCASWSSAPLSAQKNEGFAVPTQVNYVVKGGPLWLPGEKVDGSSAVISRFLRTGYLWDNVRVMGGAYGGFCSFSPYSGIFSFLSYRDPNLAKTLDIYDATGKHLAEDAIPAEELEATIIGTIGDLDSPMSPDQKGFASLIEYLEEESAEERQQWRDEILSTTPQDFKEFGERLLDLNKRATVAVVGSKKSLSDANAVLPEGQKLDVTELM